ncbi:MAG: hypothetical protein AAF639_30195, partial [Chloroflexota bacterium]
CSLLLLLIALFSVDVISQSILQAKPLTPFVADLISRPDMAVQVPEGEGLDGEANIEQQQLTDEQRHQLKWVYAAIKKNSILTMRKDMC